MKNKVYNTFKMLLLAAVVSFATSCGEKSENKKEKLADLKNQRAKIDSEIKTLEAELKASGVKLPDETQGTSVVITTMEPQTFTHYLELQGKVDADENITINADMPGTVTRVLVTPGQVVSQGQLLAEIDNAVIKSGIEEVKQQLVLATTVFEKQERLWNQKIGTEIQYLSAKTNKEALEKRLATMNEQLKMSQIKSPINGTIDEVMLKPGQMAMPGYPGIRIVNLGRLKVKSEVAETHVSRIKKGNPVVAFFPDLNTEIKSSIEFAGKVINPLNRTFTVEVKINQAVPELRPNMLSVLRIEDYKTENVFVVNANVIHSDDAGPHVMVAVEETGKWVARRRNVSLGETSGGKTEIKNGLKSGEKVITTGFQDLEDGELVRF